MLQIKYPREIYGECFDIMENRLVDFFNNIVKHQCETTAYFSYWYSHLLNCRASYELAIEWAEHGLKLTSDTDLQKKLYDVLMVSYARTRDWDKFQYYYDLASKLHPNLSFRIQQYEVARLIIINEYEKALNILKKHEISEDGNSYFWYLKSICLIRLTNNYKNITNSFQKLSNLITTQSDKWDKLRIKLQLFDLNLMYFHIKGDENKLLELAKSNLDNCKMWKNSYYENVCRYLIDKDESKKTDFDFVVEKALWM